jgi:hypothetical protein
MARFENEVVKVWHLNLRLIREGLDAIEENERCRTFRGGGWPRQKTERAGSQPYGRPPAQEKDKRLR